MIYIKRQVDICMYKQGKGDGGKGDGIAGVKISRNMPLMICSRDEERIEGIRWNIPILRHSCIHPTMQPLS